MKQKRLKSRIVALFLAVAMFTAFVPVELLAYVSNSDYIQAGEEFFPLPFVSVSDSAITAFSSANAAFNLIISTPEATAGEEVEVTISIEDNKGFASMPLQLDFPNELTLLKFDLGTNFSDAVFEPTYGTDSGVPIPVGTIDNKINFAWTRESNFTANGTLLTLTFFVSENATIGTSPITATFEGIYGNSSPKDSNGNELTVNLVQGGIEVIPDKPPRPCGDVSGNGKVDEFDAVLIVRHYVGHPNLNSLPGTTYPISQFGFDINYGKVTAASRLPSGNISLHDAVVILQYLAGHDVEICFCGLCNQDNIILDYTFSSDVTILDEAPDFSVIEGIDEFTLTINNADSQIRNLVVGNIFIIEPTDDNPQGFAGRVTSVTDLGGGTCPEQVICGKLIKKERR